MNEPQRVHATFTRPAPASYRGLPDPTGYFLSRPFSRRALTRPPRDGRTILDRFVSHICPTGTSHCSSHRLFEDCRPQLDPESERDPAFVSDFSSEGGVLFIRVLCFSAPSWRSVRQTRKKGWRDSWGEEGECVRFA